MAQWDTEESTQHLLKRAYLAMRGRADGLLGEWGVTLPQAEVLAHLWKGDVICLRDLATRLGTQPATLKGIVDGLERRGLIQRTGDTADARVKRIQLTTEGEWLRERVPAICAEVQDRALRGLPPEAADALKDWLRWIVRNLEGSQPVAPLWDVA